MTWSQSEKVPLEEIRSYLYIVLQHQQIDSYRFCYYQHIRKSAERNGSTGNTSLTHYYFPGSSNPNANKPQDNNNSFIRTRSRTSSDNSNDTVNAGVSGTLNEFAVRERVYSSEEFMESLPNTAHMTHRVTAFRSNNNSLNLSKLQNNATLSGHSETMYSLPDQMNPSERLWMEKEIIEYGPGIPDGIWFTKLSMKWMITSYGYSVVNNSTLATEKQPFSVGKNLFSDEQLTIAPKNALIRIPIRHYQDSFEIEWLKVRGIRAFSTLNSPALIALGASNQVVEEINRSRQTMLKMPNGYALKKPIHDRKMDTRLSQANVLTPSQLMSSTSTSYTTKRASVIWVLQNLSRK